jgi:hypothetical protein
MLPFFGTKAGKLVAESVSEYQRVAVSSAEPLQCMLELTSTCSSADAALV